MADPKEQIRSTSASHLERYLATDGADGFKYYGRTALILTTVGRRSGQRRSTPLYFGRDGDRYVVIGSFGGLPTHPAWYLNLQADPNVVVQVKGERFAARARTATGHERQRLWDMMADMFPKYREYQATANREIPVVVVEPLGPGKEPSLSG